MTKSRHAMTKGNWSGGCYKPPSGSRAEPWCMGVQGVKPPRRSQESAIESIKNLQKITSLCGAFSLYCIQNQDEDILKLQTMQNSGIFRTPPKPAQIIVHGYTKNYKNGEFCSLIYTFGISKH